MCDRASKFGEHKEVWKSEETEQEQEGLGWIVVKG